MEIKYYSYLLKFRHTFHIAAGARNTTDTVIVELAHNGFTGYGEVALPPYLPDNIASVSQFLSQVEIPLHYQPDDFFSLIDKWSSGNPVYPALAALDIALHDLQGKLLNLPVRRLYNIESDKVPATAYTIGMASTSEITEKLKEAKGFQFFKLKLGGEHDRELVSTFRNLTDAPFCVDANRGWTNTEGAAELCNWLQKQGCVLVEQPFEKDRLQQTEDLQRLTSVPVILDESVQILADIDKVKNSCSGINIKLAKCGGIYQAYKMIEKARKEELKIFIGCMSEGSCGIAGAAQLSPLSDWVDLDGPLLVSNDPFKGVIYTEGRIQLSAGPGTGAIPL